VQDDDCPNLKVASCDSCNEVGGCARGPCPSSIVPSDNTSCAVPPEWTCASYSYGDGLCNCGCGVVDIDCPDSKETSCQVCDGSSCSPWFCGYGIDANDNSICSSPPPSWTCAQRLYRDGSQCDCGCGFRDPDCASAAVDDCDKCNAEGSCSGLACPGLVNADDNTRCDHPPAPDGWTCYGSYYGDGYCDCGCGVPDADCRTAQVTSCQRCPICGASCPTSINPSDTTQCTPPPAGWTCPGQYYSNYTCDCGCGIKDPDCYDESWNYCSNYPVEGCSGGHPNNIDPAHNALCTLSVPSTWTCDRSFFDDSVCDCGCGAVDHDCATANRSECEICKPQGGCSTTACPGTILPNDNSSCSN
jgi:hypothetical protein